MFGGSSQSLKGNMRWPPGAQSLFWMTKVGLSACFHPKTHPKRVYYHPTPPETVLRVYFIHKAVNSHAPPLEIVFRVYFHRETSKISEISSDAIPAGEIDDFRS